MHLYVNIEKTFPDFNLSVQLEGESEIIALLGSSGCGKSLTLKCIAGIEKPDKGRIVINNEVVFDSEKGVNVPPQQRHVGYLFQNYALFPTMTVWNNIACVIKKTKSERRGIVDDIVKKFQLEGVKNLYPRQISGGQQQRAALARILVSEPKILMLDEPFSALDTHLKWRVEQEIASVLTEFEGMTIFVSHNRDEVYRISDRVAVMDNGKIESIGAKKDVFDSPKTLAAALMTGCKNISKAEKLDDFCVKATDWGIALKTEYVVPDNIKYVGVRARHFQRVSDISDMSDMSGMSDEINRFPCRVHKMIEEPFAKIFVFSFSADAENSATLQFEISKDIYGEWDSKELMLYIPVDKIMCLE